MTIFTSGSKALGVLRMAAVLALSLPGIALAAVPSTMAVHGGLFASGGGPVSDGNYIMTFSVYQAAVGGNPVYVEGPVAVAVKGGYYQYSIGSKALLDPTVLANLSTPYLGIRIGSDPELPRQPMGAVPYALRAASADGIDCSGCIKAGHLDPSLLAPLAKSASLAKVATSGAYADLSGTPDFGPYAKTAGLAKVATTGAYADLGGAPDLSVYAKAASLAKAATSGAYADITGVPDLSVYAKTANLAKVATSGKYVDLTDKPTLVAMGQSCGTGLVVKGIQEDGTLDCVEAMIGTIPAGDLPTNAMEKLSNGVLKNASGAFAVTGSLKVGGDVIVSGDLTVSGMPAGMQGASYRWNVWDVNARCGRWARGNDSFYFGNIAPSQWSNENYKASQISADKAYHNTLFSKKGFIRKGNLNVYTNTEQMPDPDSARFVGIHFRVKNKTSAAITWPVTFVYTSFPSWSNTASVSLNGADTWTTTDNCGHGCRKELTLAIPANRTSTVIFISSSGNAGNSRLTMAGFVDDSMTLPNGLEFVDDLDTASGGWDQ